MIQIMKSLDSVIITILDIGYINGDMILGENGDIHRFQSLSKLLTFVDFVPSVYQSGLLR